MNRSMAAGVRTNEPCVACGYFRWRTYSRRVMAFRNACNCELSPLDWPVLMAQMDVLQRQRPSYGRWARRQVAA